MKKFIILMFLASLIFSGCPEKQITTYPPLLECSEYNSRFPETYDHVKLSCGITNILIKKELIEKEDAHSLVKYFNSDEFFRVDIHKLTSKLINVVWQCDVNITKIMNEASKPGGTWTGGLNITRLNIAILDELYLKGHITLEEGQQVIDNARRNK